MMGLNSSWSAKGKATSAKGKSISAVMTHHSADGSPSSPCHKPLPSLPHGYSTRGATCWEVTHGNNGFPYGLCTVGPPWKDMAWFGMNLKPWGRCSIFFQEFTVHWCFHVWRRVLFLAGCTSTKMSLVCDWNQCSPLPPAREAGLQCASAEDQEEDGTAFSHCLPLFTEQLCKARFHALHWDRQERHLHTVTASGGILVIAGATSWSGTIPRHR